MLTVIKKNLLIRRNVKYCMTVKNKRPYYSSINSKLTKITFYESTTFGFGEHFFNFYAVDIRR